MPVHIENLTSEVDVVAGDLPFTEAQMEKLVAAVLSRLEVKLRERKQFEQSVRLRNQVMPPSRIGE